MFRGSVCKSQPIDGLKRYIVMKQINLATTGFELTTKRTRKREFLDEMYVVIPWFELLSLMAPHVPAGKTGRSPFATKVMLRIHLLQQFFGHSDPVSKTKMEFLKRLNRDILW